MTRLLRTFAAVLLVSVTLWADGDLQFAKLGDFELVGGGKISNCLIGYRTFGSLNAERSNAILFPTWFSGQTQDLKDFISPEGMADSSKFFVIAVDALGNSISSSPSNSREHGGAEFPTIAIADMVRSQRLLLSNEFGIERLHAVMGISMGGMQTFEWITAYPDAMRLAVPIIGPAAGRQSERSRPARLGFAATGDDRPRHNARVWRFTRTRHAGGKSQGTCCGFRQRPHGHTRLGNRSRGLPGGRETYHRKRLRPSGFPVRRRNCHRGSQQVSSRKLESPPRVSFFST
jgi:hypothetical protein